MATAPGILIWLGRRLWSATVRATAHCAGVIPTAFSIFSGQTIASAKRASPEGALLTSSNMGLETGRAALAPLLGRVLHTCANQEEEPT